MNRRNFLHLSQAALAGLYLRPFQGFSQQNPFSSTNFPLTRADFGTNFQWGTATAAYQIEGAWNEDGKGPSIWDHFTHNTKRIKDSSTGDIACDFYHKYPEDIALVKSLNIPNFRFSLAWSRIMPKGTGKVNEAGLDFYDRVIDNCLEAGIDPWLTIFHWDLPQALEEKGGWTNRDIIHWFSEYTDLVTRRYGDRVKKWMILNEPVAFTTLGYLLGYHAPGHRSFKKYFKAVHHTALCQSIGGKLAKSNLGADAEVGTTFSTSHLTPYKAIPKHERAMARYDALLNRVFLEPMLGLGYPTDGAKFYQRIEKYMEPGDEELLKWDADFVGLQYYTREVIKKLFLLPLVKGMPVKAEKKGADWVTEMGWEVHPEGFYEVMKRFASYEGVKKIYVTENGSAFPDEKIGNSVADPLRTKYLQEHLSQLHRAQQDGLPIHGYFIWTLMDNFEWKEGYHPRFGIVHVDFETQERTVKDTGKWIREFLKK